MSPQFLQGLAAVIAAYAALMGGLYAVVTVPLLRLMKAEFAAVRAEMKAEFAAVRAEMKADRAEMKLEMTEMETRLNGRIDTRLTHR